MLISRAANGLLLRDLAVGYARTTTMLVRDSAAFKQRMGWHFLWVSSFGSDFNYDFAVTIDDAKGSATYNFRPISSFMISFVPPKIRVTRASRHRRAMAYSFM